MTVEPRLTQYPFSSDETLQYEALSWCWGAGPKECALTILQQEKYHLLRISGRPAVALKQLRLRDKDELLRIDAICINQNDLDERAQQVRLWPRFTLRRPKFASRWARVMTTVRVQSGLSRQRS